MMVIILLLFVLLLVCDHSTLLFTPLFFWKYFCNIILRAKYRRYNTVIERDM